MFRCMPAFTTMACSEYSREEGQLTSRPASTCKCKMRISLQAIWIAICQQSNGCAGHEKTHHMTAAALSQPAAATHSSLIDMTMSLSTRHDLSLGAHMLGCAPCPPPGALLCALCQTSCPAKPAAPPRTVSICLSNNCNTQN